MGQGNRLQRPPPARRYYPGQEAEYQDLREPVDLGGLVVSMGMSLSTRL